ncbi:MAG: hypothetical protein IJZ37_05935 [Clostridia bacterium]|nr:hypothetical protein [Clostridia bacterium]
MTNESESECLRLQGLCENAKKDVKDTEHLLKELSENYDELISWAKLYDGATLGKKKMVVHCLINRIEVFRDYIR